MVEVFASIVAAAIAVALVIFALTPVAVFIAAVGGFLWGFLRG